VGRVSGPAQPRPLKAEYWISYLVLIASVVPVA